MKYALAKQVTVSGLVFLFLMMGSPAFPQQEQTYSTERNLSLDIGDPISGSDGSFHFAMPLLNLGGLIPLRADLIYHMSAWWVDDNKGFFHSFLNYFKFSPMGTTRRAEIYWGKNGDQIMFGSTNNGPWTISAATRKYALQETGPDQTSGYYYLMDPLEEKVFLFEKQANQTTRLKYVLDRNENRLTYEYADTTWIPQTIYEGAGAAGDRRVNIGKDNQYVNSVTEIVAGAPGRAVQYEIGPSSHLLEKATDPAGNQTVFIWQTSSGRSFITGITRPAGNTPFTQTVDFTQRRVTSQTDAYGHKTDLIYTGTPGEVTEKLPDSTEVTYLHNGPSPQTLTDPTGKQISFGKTVNNQISQVTDRLGDTTQFTYHSETGKLASFTNAAGGLLTFTYTAQDQTFVNPAYAEQVTFTFYDLTRIDYPDGTNEQFTIDTRGNVLTRVDQAGKTWTYTYNGQGQVLSLTNPFGGITTMTYNGDATLASMTDPDGVVQTFSYDLYKRLQRITHADSTYLEIVYNLNDRIQSLRDENGNTTTYTYNANGKATAVTDPKGRQIQYAYDLMDRITQITDRLGKNTVLAYDSLNRLNSITDPNSMALLYGYNSRGWLSSLTLGGQTWQTGYDDEGVPSSSTTPLSRTTTYQTDKLGNTTGITDPLSQTITLTRDAMVRVTGVTDELNRTTSNNFDNRGLLTGVTSPAIGSATYSRNDLGLLSQITDLNGRTWGFGYSQGGRRTSITDPLSQNTTYGYDNRGRLKTIGYPDGRTQTLSYDNAGNIIQRQYSGGLTLQYTYDELDRLLSSNNLTLTRDNEGRILSTDNPGVVFGASYDDGGRLRTASYNNGLFTVTYSYDGVTGLLSRVTDSLTGAGVDLGYDADRRLRTMNFSNGEQITYTWDNADRLTRIQSGNSIDLIYTLDAAGQVTSINQTAPYDPAAFLQGATDTFSYDQASQITTAGYTHDQRGRQTAAPSNTFIWDDASRLTGINGVALSYNGLGDLITRDTIHYYYNKAIGLSPVVAEKNETSGAFLRYYVWTPAGRLLYMIDASDGNKVYFYHFDRIGSTLALTDASGTVTDSYAYDPYGKLLGHNGSNPQPFTFVGQWGARQEGTNGTLYQMRARYYDVGTGRFLSREPIWPQISDPREVNPYQYALNNPQLWIDPTGYAVIVNDLWRFIEESNEWMIVEENPLPPLPRKSDPNTEKLWHLIKKLKEKNKKIIKKQPLIPRKLNPHAVEDRLGIFFKKEPTGYSQTQTTRTQTNNLESLLGEKEAVGKVKGFFDLPVGQEKVKLNDLWYLEPESDEWKKNNPPAIPNK
ncbi:MAG: RHS repeat protein [Deltaproteobacteria bacterium]|nr:RHS repeat protein [Deltaproteobacteria bacterium]